ncbi:hypothetical protein AVEN_235621-1 [Araneus ventricosus]|uniref:Uncharacterized protein n=1 Tax=Araneus ventricosus TaxID=182803 RepID=A0A4Y2BQQ8_ARAVE|nr:hypothetical protein AVEN_235621-1 [Araneus ventricosus]
MGMVDIFSSLGNVESFAGDEHINFTFSCFHFRLQPSCVCRFRVGGDESERPHGSDLIQIRRIRKKKSFEVGAGNSNEAEMQLVVKRRLGVTSRFEAIRGLFCDISFNFEPWFDDENDTRAGTSSPNCHITSCKRIIPMHWECY